MSCIQFVPKWFVRVTFKTFDARQAVLQSGIAIESSRLTAFKADPVTVEVSLEHLPFEVADEDLCQALSPFGTVHNVCLQTYADSGIFTGTRILTMSLASDVPVKPHVLGYPFHVFYHDEPRPCPICHSDGHCAASCSLRNQCCLCLQPGHFARDCELALSEHSYVPDDDSSADDVDSDAQSDEFVSGDEEVVEAVSASAPPAVLPEEPGRDVDESVEASVPPTPAVPVLPRVLDNEHSNVRRSARNVSTSDFRCIVSI